MKKQNRPHMPHIGLRTVKTGLAVALALWLADLRGSPSPIFAAIGAIVAMHRTLGDAFQMCLTQLFGILLGAGFGTVFVSLIPAFRYLGIGLGLIGLILLCVQLKLQYAVSLACMVFVSICLSPPEEAFFYGSNRLLDTSIGLITALAINILLKPYNNAARITSQLEQFLAAVPPFVEQRELLGHYPQIEPLRAQLRRLNSELEIFEKQYAVHERTHRQDAIVLRGCEQLAQIIVQELSALCAMDERGHVSPENAERLAILHLTVPEDLPAPSRSREDIVCNYHLENLLRAYQYMQDLSAGWDSSRKEASQ